MSTKNKIKVNCAYCDKEIYRFPFEIKRSKNLFCDKDCFIEYKKDSGFYKGSNNPNWKGGVAIVKCEYCGKNFERDIKVYNSRKNGKTFCSNNCSSKWVSENRVGDKCSSWKGGDVEVVCNYCNKIFLQERGFYNQIEKVNGNHYCSKECSSIYKSEQSSGHKCKFWKGGITKVAILIRISKKYNAWRVNIFKRDNYRCQICNINVKTLNAHHIISFAKILEDNNIKTFEDALNCDKLWDTNNGITLCEKCHKQIHKKLRKRIA